MKQIVFFLILFFVWAVLGCAESHEPSDNYTFRVVTIRDMSVDTFATILNQKYVLRYVGIDKDNNINKIYVDSIGELNLSHINTESNVVIFSLEKKYNPFESIDLSDCKISSDSMRGNYSIGGKTTDNPAHSFLAIKGKK